MKQSFQHYSNEINLINANQHIIHHDSGFRQTGYNKPCNNDYSCSIHSYIVDWQIQKDAKKENS